VGIIYDLDEPKYLSYGLSGEYNIAPPSEVADMCDWLPISLENQFDKGYWLIYQDAMTGKTVKPTV
jgi:hypothetical protein